MHIALVHHLAPAIMLTARAILLAAAASMAAAQLKGWADIVRTARFSPNAP